MRRLVLLVCLLLAVAAPALAVNPDEILPDPVLEARARDISAGLRCLVCQNQSIDDSDAELARDLRILVRERLLACKATRRVECEHASEEVECLGIRVAVHSREGHARANGQRADVLLRTRRANAAQCILGGRAEALEDLVELVDVVAALEDRLAAKQLREDAPNRPHIDARRLRAGQPKSNQVATKGRT